MTHDTTRNTTPDETLAASLKALGIPDDEWDFLVFTDGSGTTNQKTCGWGVVIVRKGCPPLRLHGSLSHGTNIVAEIMGPLQALGWIWREMLQCRPALQRVHLVTDCRHVTCPETWTSHRDLASLVAFYSRESLRIIWHWMERDSLLANVFCHDVANLARLGAEDVNLHPAMPDPNSIWS